MMWKWPPCGPRRIIVELILVLAFAGSGVTEASQEPQVRRPAPPRLAPYVPSPPEVVDRLLRLAQVSAQDVVYDLGSGDGRIVIAAAKTFGARGVGVEISPLRIAEANAYAAREGVADRVHFTLGDALATDVSSATVVTLYLSSAANLKLRPILTQQLRPGARIVSHSFSMGDWRPDQVSTFVERSGGLATLYLWTTDGKLRP